MLAPLLDQLNHLQSRLRPVEVWGFLFKPPTLDRRLALLAHRWNLMGRGEKRFLEQQITAGANVIDVGSNQGLYALLAARLASVGTVFALEPDPELFAALTQNISANHITNVRALEFAAGESEETLFFRPGKLNRGDNRIQKPGCLSNLQVRATRLDDLIPPLPIRLLKIDVQGWEIPVLRGAGRIIAESQEIIILIEFWPYGLRSAGFEPAELLEQLARFDFSLFQLTPAGSWAPLGADVLRYSSPRYYLNLVACRDAALTGRSNSG